VPSARKQIAIFQSEILGTQSAIFQSEILWTQIVSPLPAIQVIPLNVIRLYVLIPLKGQIYGQEPDLRSGASSRKQIAIPVPPIQVIPLNVIPLKSQTDCYYYGQEPI
jgi:hypothetical protein